MFQQLNSLLLLAVLVLTCTFPATAADKGGKPLRALLITGVIKSE